MAKKYIFKLVIHEGNDEFWEEVAQSKTGCDMVYEQIKTILYNYGLDTDGKYANCELKLTEYTDK